MLASGSGLVSCVHGRASQRNDNTMQIGSDVSSQPGQAEEGCSMDGEPTHQLIGERC